MRPSRRPQHERPPPRPAGRSVAVPVIAALPTAAASRAFAAAWGAYSPYRDTLGCRGLDDAATDALCDAQLEAPAGLAEQDHLDSRSAGVEFAQPVLLGTPEDEAAAAMKEAGILPTVFIKGGYTAEEQAGRIAPR